MFVNAWNFFSFNHPSKLLNFFKIIFLKFFELSKNFLIVSNDFRDFCFIKVFFYSLQQLHPPPLPSPFKKNSFLMIFFLFFFVRLLDLILWTMKVNPKIPSWIAMSLYQKSGLMKKILHIRITNITHSPIWLYLTICEGTYIFPYTKLSSFRQESKRNFEKIKKKMK